jgi:hypothetical protein
MSVAYNGKRTGKRKLEAKVVQIPAIGSDVVTNVNERGTINLYNDNGTLKKRVVDSNGTATTSSAAVTFDQSLNTTDSPTFAGLTAPTIRGHAVPSGSGNDTLALLAASQTLTNKTLQFDTCIFTKAYAHLKHAAAVSINGNYFVEFNTVVSEPDTSLINATVGSAGVPGKILCVQEGYYLLSVNAYYAAATNQQRFMAVWRTDDARIYPGTYVWTPSACTLRVSTIAYLSANSELKVQIYTGTTITVGNASDDTKMIHFKVHLLSKYS